MRDDIVILIAEDDAGHFALVKKNLWRSCVENEIIQFKDGQEILDFLFQSGKGPKRVDGGRYILLLDIRMPKINGREVLRRIKSDETLRNIPVVMLTTADDEDEIDQCYKMGCSFYIVKPPDYNRFMETVKNLGNFLALDGVVMPKIDTVADEEESLV